MTHDDLSPTRFAGAFLAFLEAVNRHAAPPGPSLADRIEQHLGTEPSRLQVVTEQLDAFEHPNVQVALNSYLDEIGPGATWLGIAGDQEQYVTSAIGMIVGQDHIPGMHRVGVGPVDEVTFRVSDGNRLPCVQHGILLCHDGEVPLVVLFWGRRRCTVRDRRSRSRYWLAIRSGLTHLWTTSGVACAC